MVRKKDRILVVIDTNVFIANHLSTNLKSPNVAIIRLWRERKLQLIVSDDIAQEYFGTLAELDIPENLVTNFLTSLRESGTATALDLANDSVTVAIRKIIRFCQRQLLVEQSIL